MISYFSVNLFIFILYFLYMKKNTVKAFTLVEMLIVIVIIGILIAALLPRMQGAQWRARDVSRQTNLSQIATAIVSSQADKRNWPKQASGAEGMNVLDIKTELFNAGMSDVPSDPNGVNSVWGLGKFNGSGTDGKNQWNYIYMVTDKNWASQAGFILMASTETEGASNWVTCNNEGLTGGYIATGTDLSTIHVCTSLELSGTAGCTVNNADWACTYSQVDQLRYIYMY